MFACTGLLELASALASAVTFVTYIGLLEVPASNLGSDMDCTCRFFLVLLLIPATKIRGWFLTVVKTASLQVLSDSLFVAI
jgi:hypothetical protein